MGVKVKIDSFINARIKKGFSQRRLAEVAGLSSALISQIENHGRNPSPSSANKICKALDVEFDDIFFTHGVSNSKQQSTA